ncbi:hypothetical protein KAU45_06420 [bacterium]|nr:hypothetical protein [bacterium]
MRIGTVILLLALVASVQAEVYEFYWDDGVAAGGWVWYTGGGYWAVEFDEEKTYGESGTVVGLGAYVMPGWPDGSYQGAYLHVLSDSDGLPGEDLTRVYISGPEWQWVDAEVDLDEGVFWMAWEQIGSYPSCDALGFDEEGTGHTWGGDWIYWGDAMLRCYWDGVRITVEETTWGLIKALW